MFFCIALAFLMIQWVLAIWSLVSLPFLKPANYLSNLNESALKGMRLMMTGWNNTVNPISPHSRLCFCLCCTNGNLSTGPSKSSSLNYCPDLSDLTPRWQHGPKEEAYDIEVQEGRLATEKDPPSLCPMYAWVAFLKIWSSGFPCHNNWDTF